MGNRRKERSTWLLLLLCGICLLDINRIVTSVFMPAKQGQTFVVEAVHMMTVFGKNLSTESAPKEEVEKKEEKEYELIITEPVKDVVAVEKAKEIDIEALKDFTYLKKTFYQVDSATSVDASLLDVEKMLEKDMTIDTTTDGAQILIYHTHSQEAYADSKPGDSGDTVVGVGEYLTKLLEEKGYRVLHHTGEYDKNSRDKAYTLAEPAIEQLLEENPSIQVVIDLHRDGVAETTHLVTEIDGNKVAKVMFFNGVSRSAKLGEIKRLANPYLADNLAFSFQMQMVAKEYYPDLTRKIYLKTYRYNMHLCPKTLLVEVGAQTNTVSEAKNAMVYLADVLDKVLKMDK